ncbi:MAG: uroporphyrinogen decarboxylase family protein [Lentisphaeria bacterium]|jgi:uroporphyrinogen decarboxylase
MSLQPTEQHLALARQLVAEAHAAPDGLAPVDLERFWADDAQAKKDPFAADCPQVPLGVMMSHECVFAELGEPEQWGKLIHDEAYRLGLCRRYNDLAAKIVGRRILPETMANPAHKLPPVKELHEIFEGRNTWHEESWSYWLHSAAESEDDLARLLDRVETRLEKLREFILPPGWDEAKRRVLAAGGTAPLYRGQRGPVTFAMSIFGVEKLIFLILDNPELAARYRDLILRAMLERARILDEEAGFTPATAPHGFGFADDNCCLLSAEMYEFFGWPILKAMFDRYSPAPGDSRYQHSDSAMGHLLPLLGKLGLTGVNFGPTLTVREIRGHLPQAVIHGQLAPFTFSRHEEANIVAEFLRDFEMARETRGLQFATAGSINNGSRLAGMRLIMAAIQRWGRYA